MARIRTIKPEFAESESVGKLSREARLLFILLWTFVDDSGRARASSRLLASRLYPYDDDAQKRIGGWLAELEAGGHVRLYEVDGDSYLDIPKWLKHQKIDRPTPSRLPEYREGSMETREDSRGLDAHTLDHGPRTVDRGPDAPGGAGDLSEDDLQQVRDAYAAFVLTAKKNGWPTPRNLDADRKRKLRARLKDHGLDGWQQMLGEAEASDWIRTEFKLRLDWVLEPKNFRKVVEGNYRNTVPEQVPRRVVGFNG